jgi:16S rRNA (guanine527-N7)-methyltransferase
MLDAARMAELLAPYLGDAVPPPQLFAQLQVYIDLLLRWNARTNLTAIRDPEQIVTRHFGESLFAARVLRDAGALDTGTPTLSDLGSGAGFPGVPIRLFVPNAHLTLIESHNKKATFLKEVIRALRLTNAEVFCGRAETLGQKTHIVTLRAVERFETVLPVAKTLVAAGGTLCLLIGEVQETIARELLRGEYVGYSAIHTPNSSSRVVLRAKKES